MIYWKHSWTFLLATLIGATAAAAASGPTPDVIITRERDDLGFPKPVPVSISGFTGDALATLRNDLLFMGITDTTPDAAKFLISGSSAGRVEGRVMEKVTKNSLLARAYTGASLRSQIHAFADDIAQKLTGLPGIAQKKIAFKAETGEGRSEIYIADFDGHNAQAATQDGTLTVAPCWGGPESIFYCTYKHGNAHIVAHQIRSGARSIVSRQPGGNYSPAVSRDGRRLAMILSKTGNPELWVAGADGAGLKQLTQTREAESSPCWSPDGQTVCYVSRASGVASLYLIPASGGAPRRLSASPYPNPTEPDWSPDGKWIAFTSQAGGNFSICIVPAAGGAAVQLAAGEDPSWAANSRAIIFSRGPDRSKSLYLLDAPTQQVKSVARILGGNTQPGWAR
jgi:TolB protein